MTDDNDRLDALEARLDALEAENEQLREENDQLHDRVDDLEDSEERLAEENARLKQRVADLEEQPTVRIENEKNPVGSLKIGEAHVGEAISGRVSEYDLENELADLKADLEASNPTPEGGETTVQQHDTPLEQVVAMPEHIVDDQLTANQERARFIASSITDYATKVRSGDYILTAADLRSVLRAAYDTAHSETVDRVRTILADLGDDDVELQEPRTAGFSPDTKEEKRRQGKKLVVSSSLVRRLSKIDHDVVTEAEA
jgi:DNA repair exonuclease SbcCD ATPase subunit